MTMALITLPYIFKDYHLDRNDFIIAVLVFHLKLMLNLKMSWTEEQSEKFFDNKKKNMIA